MACGKQTTDDAFAINNAEAGEMQSPPEDCDQVIARLQTNK